MTPDETAYQIVCDVFGSESGWEHVTRMIADALRAAVAAERARCLGSLEETRSLIIGHANATRDLGALDALEMAEKLIREGT